MHIVTIIFYVREKIMTQLLKDHVSFPQKSWKVSREGYIRISLNIPQVEVWENQKCCGNTSCSECFHSIFRVLPNFHECFYNLETRRICFLFLLECTTTKKKGKQLVYFDDQNLNSLCLHHHHLNSLCQFCISNELQKQDF